MKSAMLLVLATAACAAAATEEKLSQRFNVEAGGAVVLNVEFGTVDVSTNAGSEVVVDVWRKIGRKKKADEEAYLREHPVKFSHDGDTVTVECHGPTKRSFLGSGTQHNEAVYTLRVPARFNARLRSGGGAMQIADLTGEVKANTGGGGISLVRIHGPQHGETGGGGVKAVDCEGALTLRTGGGNLEVRGGAGSLNGTTGGGSINVSAFGGPAQLVTGGGGLNLERVKGELDASTGGGSVVAVLPSEVAASVKLSTGGGGVTVSVPHIAAFNLDAHTGGGDVMTDLPVTVVGKIRHDSLVGPVNGGGKLVKLQSGGGNIRIKKL